MDTKTNDDNGDYYYREIGYFFMESKICLIGDTIITLNRDDDRIKIDEHSDLDKYIDDIYQINCVILKNVSNNTCWNVYLKINLNNDKPTALIALEGEYIDDSIISDIDNNNWDFTGTFDANFSFGIYDINYFDNDEFIKSNYFEKYSDKVSAWYHYAIEEAEKAYDKYHCNTISFGASMSKIYSNYFDVYTITRPGIYDTVGIKIEFNNLVNNTLPNISEVPNISQIPIPTPTPTPTPFFSENNIDLNDFVDIGLGNRETIQTRNDLNKIYLQTSLEKFFDINKFSKSETATTYPNSYSNEDIINYAREQLAIKHKKERLELLGKNSKEDNQQESSKESSKESTKESTKESSKEFEEFIMKTNKINSNNVKEI
jgi:hypothetical protein